MTFVFVLRNVQNVSCRFALQFVTYILLRNMYVHRTYSTQLTFHCTYNTGHGNDYQDIIREKGKKNSNDVDQDPQLSPALAHHIHASRIRAFTPFRPPYLISAPDPYAPSKHFHGLDVFS